MFKNTLRRGMLLVGFASLSILLSVTAPSDSFARHKRSGKVVRNASHGARHGRHGKPSRTKHHVSRVLNDVEKDEVIAKLKTITGVELDSASANVDSTSMDSISDAPALVTASDLFGYNFSVLSEQSYSGRDANVVNLGSEIMAPQTNAADSTAKPVIKATKSDVVASIIDWLGTPYVFGGSSHKGIDCSAFTRGIFRQSFGVDLPRTAAMQSVLGSPVAKNLMQFGDMVFFKTARYAAVTHVGIYVGEGLFANAQGSRGVTLASLEDPYWSRKFLFAKRLYSSTQTAQTEVNKQIDLALASGSLDTGYHKFD